MTPPHEWCKVDRLVGRFPRLGRGLGHCVGLPLPLHRVRIEGVGVTGSEGRSGGHQDVVEAACQIAAGAQLDAGGVDTLFLREVLRNVEVSLGRGVRCFIGRMLADNNQFGRRFAVEGEGDLIEATLSFVVDADGTLSVALEGEAAKIAYLRRWRRGRSRDGD